MILPLGERTGAETEATPARARRPTAPSRGGGCRRARRRRTRRSGGRGACAPGPPTRAAPGRPTRRAWSAGSRPGSCRAGRRGVRRRRRRRAMSPWRRHSCAVSPVMSRSAPAPAGGRQQPVLAGGGGEFGQPGTEDEAALHVAGDQAVVLQRDGEPVRGGPGQPGAADQSGQGGRPRLEGGEHERGLVENADAGALELSIWQYCRLRSWDARSTLDKLNGPSRGSGHGQDTDREGLGRARCPVGRWRTRPPLHRPAPHPRGHQPAGVRRPAARRPDRPPPRPDPRDRGPQRPDRSTGTSRSQDPVSRTQVETLRKNAEEFGVRLHPLGDPDQGIVHVIGPSSASPSRG